MSREAYRAWLTLAAALVFVQSLAHVLAASLYGTGSAVDLDRSGAIPDVAATAITLVAAVGAGLLSHRRRGTMRAVAAVLAVSVLIVALDDVIGVDRDVSAAATLLVTGIAIAVTAGLALGEQPPGRRAAAAMLLGLLALSGALAVGQLSQLMHWFESPREDVLVELQIIVRQALELAGWCLVALGVWDLRGLGSNNEGEA